MIKAFLSKNSFFAKIAGIGFITTITRTGVNLAISKILALGLGASGIAIYSQLLNYTAVLTVFSTGATTTGVVKLSSEHKGDNNFITSLKSTAYKLNLGISLLLFLTFLVFPNRISTLIFGSTEFVPVIRLLSVSILFGGLNSICTSLLNGLGKYRLFLTFQLVTNFSLLFLVAILVYFLKDLGALYAYLATQILAFILMVYSLVKNNIFQLRYYTNKLFELSILKQLGKFTLMSLAAVLFINVSQIIIRTYVVNAYSQDEAGLWDAMLRISGAYFSIIISSLSIYYLPKLASLLSKSEIKREIFYVLKLMAPFILIAFIVIYFLRSFIISLLFSSEFLSITDYFLPIMIGDFFKWIGWIFSYVLISKSAIVFYLLNEFVAFSLIISLTIFGTKYMGFSGLFYGQMVCYFIYMLTSITVCYLYFNSKKTALLE